jgi:hypothetical protein
MKLDLIFLCFFAIMSIAACSDSKDRPPIFHPKAMVVGAESAGREACTAHSGLKSVIFDGEPEAILQDDGQYLTWLKAICTDGAAIQNIKHRFTQ